MCRKMASKLQVTEPLYERTFYWKMEMEIMYKCLNKGSFKKDILG